jgi:hypothetical protein
MAVGWVLECAGVLSNMPLQTDLVAAEASA